MNTLNSALTVATLATLAALAQPSLAASISLSPSVQVLNDAAGTATFDLLMGFAANEATIGGGIDLDFDGPAVFAGFTPSAYFNGAADPAFSGFGALYADKDLEIHFGHFNGLSGQNRLGTLTFTYNTPGTTTIALGINTYFGDVYSVASNKMRPKGRNTGGTNCVVSYCNAIHQS